MSGVPPRLSNCIRFRLILITFGVLALFGSLLVSGSADCSLKLWEVVADKDAVLSQPWLLLKHTLQRQLHMDILTVDFAPAGDFLISGCEDSSLRLWSTRGVLLNTLSGEYNYILSAAICGDGLAVTGHSNRVLCLWQLTDNCRLLATIRAHTGPVRAVLLV